MTPRTYAALLHLNELLQAAMRQAREQQKEKNHG